MFSRDLNRPSNAADKHMTLAATVARKVKPQAMPIHANLRSSSNTAAAKIDAGHAIRQILAIMPAFLDKRSYFCALEEFMALDSAKPKELAQRRFEDAENWRPYRESNPGYLREREVS
jgi:hypothetical protein